MMYEEKNHPFVVGAITGCILWVISFGFIHAYVISPDWEVMEQNTINAIFGWRPFIALVVTGFVFGLSVEVARFIGVVFRSEGAILFLPVFAGAVIGALQGKFVASNLWGFAPGTVFRDEYFRLWTGAVGGLILSVPTVVIGIIIRHRSRP
ncbi:MAG: hypothetical protein ACPLXL_00205 [Minisyncoccia bacterium]